MWQIWIEVFITCGICNRKKSNGKILVRETCDRPVFDFKILEVVDFQIILIERVKTIRETFILRHILNWKARTVRFCDEKLTTRQRFWIETITTCENYKYNCYNLSHNELENHRPNKFWIETLPSVKFSTGTFYNVPNFGLKKWGW